MNKLQYIARFFLIVSGLATVIMLKMGKPVRLENIILCAIGFGLLVTIVYIFIKKPLLHIYRWYFDKEYKYHISDKKKGI